MKTLKISLFTLCILTVDFFCVNAQKLPAIQPSGVKAPFNIKTDGMTAEWNNKFQAFNHNIDAFYTIANDDSYLYLVVQAKDEVIAKKIISGGIALSISSAKNKFEQGAVVGPIMSDGGRASVIDGYMQFKEYADSKGKTKQTDSLLSVINKELTKNSKEIIVSGIKGIDNVISVYNTYGIKSATLFDKTGALTWELAIPLKYLKNAMNDQPKFFYNLMIRGAAINAKAVKSKTGEAVTVTDVPISSNKGRATDMDILMNNTDFWAEYNLVK